jgi:pyruvate kinase
MPRRTKIVATLGPASSDRLTLESMIEAGMDVAYHFRTARRVNTRNAR